MNLKNPPGTCETIENAYLDLWQDIGPSRAKLYVTRRAVVSRVIRVQRRYAVRIQPMESRGLVNFGWITERSKGLAHERFFLDPYVVNNNDFS